MANRCIFLVFTLSLVGCVGPTSPFGSIDSLKSSVKMKERHSIATSKAYFHFYPQRQVLHGPQDLKITLVDAEGLLPESEIKAFYQGVDISKTVFSRAQSTRYKNQWIIEVKNLKLPLRQDHSIEFVYERTPAQWVASTWGEPNCYIFDSRPVVSTHPFKPQTRMLTSINKWSKHYEVNSSLLTGLIAQESSFNPRAISWSKAIGLTQVTPIADKEIQSYRSDWPRAPEVRELPVLLLKPLVRSGKITPQDDWRLAPDLSIQGGLIYLSYLKDYWSKPQNLSLIEAHLEDQEDALTDVILASYNSGAARVNYALKTEGSDYLSVNQLSEAKKYVKKIKSYCYHFGSKGREP